MNQELADMFDQIARLLEIKGDSAYRIGANKRVAMILRSLSQDVNDIYTQKKLKGLMEIKGIGESSAKKIEEYIKSAVRRTGPRVKSLVDLEKETAIQQVVSHFFESKGVPLQELKNNAKKRNIVYSRFTKPAKQLIDLAGGVEKAKQAISTVAAWANSRKLDYAIETVFKKWLELDKLKPKEKVKKAFYKGDPMVYSEPRRKWYVITKNGEWLTYADKESEIEWKEI